MPFPQVTGELGAHAVAGDADLRHAQPGFVGLMEVVHQRQAAAALAGPDRDQNLVEERADGGQCPLGVGISGSGCSPDAAGLEEEVVVLFDVDVDERDRSGDAKTLADTGHEVLLFPSAAALL